MKRSILIIFTLLVFVWGLPVSGGHAGFKDLLNDMLKGFKDTGALSENDIINGLKEALEIGTSNAVKTVSKINGYYKNPEIKIPLPENVQKVENLLRTIGYAEKVDQFELSMNRAAEKAAPEAKSLFWKAIKQMTFDDARKILDGRDNEATLYFKDKTEDRLAQIFKPKVHTAMSDVGVTRVYQNINTKMKTLPLADSYSFDLDQYVTNKALDGLFMMLAQEEKKIREDPAARVTDLLQKVFGSK